LIAHQYIINSAAVNPAESFILLPITLVSAYVSNTTSGALVAPTTAYSPWVVHGLKGGNWNLIISAEVLNNGIQLEQNQTNSNVFYNFKLLSQFSQDNLNAFGSTLGLGSMIDNVQSMKFNGSGNQALGGGTLGVYTANTLTAVTGLIGGNGLVNNSPFPTPTFAVAIATSAIQTTNTSGVIPMTNGTTGIAVGQLVIGTDVAVGTTVSALIPNASIQLSLPTSAQVPNDTTLYFYTLPAGNTGDQSLQGLQGYGAYNNGYYSRLKKYADTTNGTVQNLRVVSFYFYFYRFQCANRT
jgi:hypothetical protein